MDRCAIARLAEAVTARVSTVERVALAAVRHACKLCGDPAPTQGVLPESHRLQVARVDAGAVRTRSAELALSRVVAGVVERHPFGYGADQQFVRGSMRLNGPMTRDVEP